MNRTYYFLKRKEMKQQITIKPDIRGFDIGDTTDKNPGSYLIMETEKRIGELLECPLDEVRDYVDMIEKVLNNK